MVNRTKYSYCFLNQSSEESKCENLKLDHQEIAEADQKSLS